MRAAPHRLRSAAPDAQPYKIDSYQAGYFVIDSIQQLFDATAPDFTPIYAEVRDLPLIEAGAALPGERQFAPAC